MNAQNCFVGNAFGGVCLVALLSGCDVLMGPTLRGSGVAKTETRTTAPFTKIEIGGGIQLDATVGPETTVVVTADENILPHLKTDVVGDRLQIYVDTSYSSDVGVQMQASMPTLTALEGNGATKSTLNGVAGEEFHLELTGASDCRFSGEVDRLETHVSGASHCTLVGSAQSLSIDCSGASRVDALELTTEDVAADLSGASSANVNAAMKLAVQASGASHLRYQGEPSKLEKRVSGASTVAPE